MGHHPFADCWYENYETGMGFAFFVENEDHHRQGRRQCPTVGKGNATGSAKHAYRYACQNGKKIRGTVLRESAARSNCGRKKRPRVEVRRYRVIDLQSCGAFW
ncbi:hypothetical protein NDU88_007563 [Pleurodeles waltl]|uniref:Uncharacterized protein n=1 Tax=Pleurodeles waltl TaxID=8319 RepID=A0AAV7PLP5_PLEWA|nr:hypothetical protein NDU88_007563 [Pleurodeles waltl]